MHTLSTGIHISNLLRIKLVTGFPSGWRIFPRLFSPIFPPLQTLPFLLLLAGIGEIQAAFEPADPQAVIAASPKGE
jgi:hypothetical protein